MEEVLQNNVALYAAIKTFHGGSHDMWAAVSALTLLVMPESGSEEDVKSSFAHDYQLEIPTEALRTVLARLKKEGQISYIASHVKLTDKGARAKSKLEESLTKVRREYSTLTESFRKYLVDKKITPPNPLDGVLLSFIDDNIGFASEVITSKNQKRISAVPASLVADYILSIEKTDAALFEILQNVFFGRIYLTLIKKRTELDSNAKFDKLVVYLDTNIILSLLGLRDEIIVKSSQELLEVLREYSSGLTVAVLEASLDEASQLLKAFANQDKKYIENLQVDSIHYRMRIQHIDRQDLILLIENLESKVAALGIVIEPTPLLNEKKLDDTRSDIMRNVNILGLEKEQKALEHDAILLESIRAKRGKIRTQLLEKSKAIFVTPDKSIIAHAKTTSSNENTFPLAIRPIDIVSLLWVKAIGSDGKFSGKLLRLAVMGYARERSISDNLWSKFVSRLGEAKTKGDISDEDIGIILAADETEKLLSSHASDKAIVDKIINPDYVKKIRDEQSELEQGQRSSEAKAKVLSLQLDETTNKLGQLKEEKKDSDARISRISASVGRIAKNIASALTIAMGFVISAGLVWALWFGLIVIGAEKLSAIIPLCLIAVVGICILTLGKEFKPILLILKIRRRVEATIERKMHALLSKFIDLVPSEDTPTK